MSKVQLLRDNLRRRLTADDKEIFELFEGVVSDYEGVIADYEEEICCLKEENKGWKVLAAVFNPQVHLYRADPQQPFLNKDDVIPEHQEHAANAVRNGSQPTNIKEEQEELWVNQEGKQLHGLREADITKFPFAVVSVKSEDEEKPQSSQLRQNQRDERTEVELLSSTSAEHRTLKTEANGDDCGGSQPGSNSGPCSQLQPHIDAVQQLLIKEESLPEQQILNLSVNQEDVKEERGKLWISQPGPQAGTTKFPFTAFPVKSEDDEKPQSAQAHQSQSDESTEVEGVASSSTAHRTPTAQGDCKDYGGRQPANTSGPDSPLQPHTSGRSSDSSETDSCKWKRIKKCSSGFNCPKNGKVSVSHNRSSMTKKQMNCCEYRKECGHVNYLKRPKGRQQSEKPFRCSECGKRFGNKWNLNRHIKIHTGQKPFRCSECGKRFAENCDLNKHKKIHSGQKPFGCSECGKKFGQKSYLTKHAIIHTGHKPFSCSECGKGFGQKISLIRHMMIHTGHLALIKSQIFG